MPNTDTLLPEPATVTIASVKAPRRPRASRSTSASAPVPLVVAAVKAPRRPRAKSAVAEVKMETKTEKVFPEEISDEIVRPVRRRRKTTAEKEPVVAVAKAAEPVAAPVRPRRPRRGVTQGDDFEEETVADRADGTNGTHGADFASAAVATPAPVVVPVVTTPPAPVAASGPEVRSEGTVAPVAPFREVFPPSGPSSSTDGGEAPEREERFSRPGAAGNEFARPARPGQGQNGGRPPAPAGREDRGRGRDARQRDRGGRNRNRPERDGRDRGGERGPERGGERFRETQNGGRTDFASEGEPSAAAFAEPQPGDENYVPPALREPEFAEGAIEISGKGFGFLREAKKGFAATPADVFVPPEIVRRHQLRDGMVIHGEVRRGSRGSQMIRLMTINGDDPIRYRGVLAFEELTVTNPARMIRMETTQERLTTRIIDLMTPIGRGQRGLIVAPPRTGKTTLLHHIAEAVCANHPEITLMVLLVDERPEEVTELRRALPKAEVWASSNDSDVKSHTRIAQFAIERARRLVEGGRHVFILLDSITRLARSFNNAMAGGGKTGSGGMDTKAMEIPRRLFASARNTEEAGSLTIVATALVDTGSRMDDYIFQEFKGTGNMELVLDRRISDQRVYPAVDIFQSGTRREELILPPDDLERVNTIRRGLAGIKAPDAIERLLFVLKKFPSNAAMLKEIPL